MDALLLQILRCPHTMQPVQLVADAELQSYNEQIEQRILKHSNGAAVEEKLEAALKRKDCQVLYRVRNGIPIMIWDEAIAL